MKREHWKRESGVSFHGVKWCARAYVGGRVYGCVCLKERESMGVGVKERESVCGSECLREFEKLGVCVLYVNSASGGLELEP